MTDMIKQGCEERTSLNYTQYIYMCVCDFSGPN